MIVTKPSVLSISKKLGNVPCVGAYYSFNHGTHTAHFRVKICRHTRNISDFFVTGLNRRCLFTPDLLLFKPNTARNEGISANSQTQHWRTTNIWLQWRHRMLFFFVGSPNRVNLLLFSNPSYLGVMYITPTKHYTPNFTSLVSLMQVSV